MELSKYLETTGITANDFAVAVGVEPSAISNYRQGIRKPRPEIATRIVKFTKGQVSFSDLYATHDVKRGNKHRTKKPACTKQEVA